MKCTFYITLSSIHVGFTRKLYFFCRSIEQLYITEQFYINLLVLFSVYLSLLAFTVMRLSPLLWCASTLLQLQESLVYVRVTIKSNKLKLNLRIFFIISVCLPKLWAQLYMLYVGMLVLDCICTCTVQASFQLQWQSYIYPQTTYETMKLYMLFSTVSPL